MEVAKRPCCGAKVPMARIYEGSVHFPHKQGCPYYRKKKS